MTPIKVAVERLSKQFKIYRRASGRLREWASFGRRVEHTLFTALENVTFSMRQGEFFGVIGPNGSGKSTLLKILTGVMYATSGTHRVDGRITSLLELGTGFHPDLTGRDNIINSARLLGFADSYVRARLDEMIAFAEIDDYIDQPIKYYSSGMLVRLAFSVFSHVEPDVFIIDEALSVGDVYFSQKCFRRLDQMRSQGCTVLFVSHDLTAVRRYCDQVLYLHRGRMRYLGKAIDATDVYLEAMSPGGAARDLAPESNGQAGPEPAAAERRASRAGRSTGGGATASGPTAATTELVTESGPTDAATQLRRRLPPLLAAAFTESMLRAALEFRGARIGSGEVRIVGIRIINEGGAPRERFALYDEIHVQVLAEVLRDVERGTMSIQVTNRMGVVVWGTNHALLGHGESRLVRDTWALIHFILKPGLGPGEYTVDVGFGDASGEGHVFDRMTAAARIEVAAEGYADFMGLARIPCTSEYTYYPKTP